MYSILFWEGYPFYLGVVFSSGGVSIFFWGEGGRWDLSDLVSISFAGYYAFGRGVHFIWG